MLTLHTYWRSSAAYRVRIALAYKGLTWQAIAVNLLNDEQRLAQYRALNPQGLVPLLQDDSSVITQSLAIIEYLDETHPRPPLLPSTPAARARARSMALLIACDIHPLINLRVTRYLKDRLGQSPSNVDEWIRHWIHEGLQALEAQISPTDRYLGGDSVSLADVCLVPQLYGAARFSCDLRDCPKLVAIGSRLAELPAFSTAHPDRQADAPAALKN